VPDVKSHEVSFDERFWASVSDLDAGKSHRVIESLNLFRENPTHPNLRLKPLKGDLSELWSVRAGRDVRILMVRRGETYLWLEAGMRRDIYDKAARGRFVMNPNRRVMVFADPEVADDHRRRPTPTGDPVLDGSRPGVFDHWGTPELAEIGFSPEEIESLRELMDEYDLLTLGWADDRVDTAVAILEMTPEQWRDRASGATAATDAEQRIRSAISDYGALTGISPLFSPEELERIAAAPIEDWMIFLHPDQRSIVNRHFDGPARIRGAAGTGKTVVALHRAAALAQRYAAAGEGEKVLFTTFITTLPPVFEQLYKRLPDSVPGVVDFLHIDQVARRVCDSVGEGVAVDQAAVDEAFDEAADVVLLEGSPLDRAGLSRPYLRTEIQKVIKGRNVESLDAYLTVTRTGRSVGFTEAMRRQVWMLGEAWDQAMAERGTLDHADVILRALAVAGSRPVQGYRSVIVDEAQDLTLAGLQLLRRLVNGPTGADRPDGLFIVGDGAQRVYPGGFTLRQAGVEVRGRTTVLKVNYRNTAEIISAALAVAGAQRVIDLDEEFRRGEATPDATRHGPMPTLQAFPSAQAEADHLATVIRDLASEQPVGLGDIAVFTPSNDAASSIVKMLEAAGIRSRSLVDYEGVTSDDVKVGTYIRAKGLEFKAVFLPGLDASAFPRPRRTGEGAEEFEERTAVELGQLFVAMTRARDLLSVTCVGDPSPTVLRAEAAFDRAG